MTTAILTTAFLFAAPALLPSATADITTCYGGGPDCMTWSWIQITVSGTGYTVTRPVADPDAVGSSPPVDSSCSSTPYYASSGFVKKVVVDCLPFPTNYNYGASCVSPPCKPACFDPTIKLRVTDLGLPLSPRGETTISAKCANSTVTAGSGITCTMPGLGTPAVGTCDCSGTPCNPVSLATCNVGWYGTSCVPGTAACGDTGTSVDCQGTDKLYLREVTHLYCETSIEKPEVVIQWIATCSGTDP